MRKYVCAALLVIATACGQPDTSAPTTLTAVAPTTAPAQQGSVPAAGSVEALAAKSAGTTLGIAGDQLRLLTKEEKQWPNSALGCEEADMMYMQVITPGYLLTYTDGSKSIEVHSDQTGENTVVCENGKPVKQAQ